MRARGDVRPVPYAIQALSAAAHLGRRRRHLREEQVVIADVPRPPIICWRCARLDSCPTPQACEQAEQDRIDRAAWRDFRVAAALIVVLGVVILVLTNWSPKA